MGEAEREVITWDPIWHTVHVHEVSRMELPAKSKRSKASLLTDTIQISIFTKNKETGEDEEIDKGYSVGKSIYISFFELTKQNKNIYVINLCSGSGQGIIFYEYKGKIKVEGQFFPPIKIYAR